AFLMYEGRARFRNGSESEPVTTVVSSLALRGVRMLPASAAWERRAQAQRLTEAADLLFSRSGQWGEARLRQSQARLASLRQRYPQSAYAPAADALGELARMRLGYIQQGQELERQKAALIGSPAPALSLKDLEGKEHTLGEYRGKLILLNVFASW